ncbi:hypothetical protein [Amycolatopsis samaneae]|uniref:Uncharacterized protein n=1 Tax=Amycolatopsis samaneae TaxID=664691 RepID=A0ABW5GU24_9PSEU
MNPVGGYLVVLGGLLLLYGLAALVIRRYARDTGRHADADGVSVQAIRARVQRERFHEQLTGADTEVLPVTPEPAGADEPPTEPLSLPKRARRYVQPTPYPRTPVKRPSLELKRRVLEGLEHLDEPDEQPGQELPESDLPPGDG